MGASMEYPKVFHVTIYLGEEWMQTVSLHKNGYSNKPTSPKEGRIGKRSRYETTNSLANGPQEECIWRIRAEYREHTTISKISELWTYRRQASNIKEWIRLGAMHGRHRVRGEGHSEEHMPVWRAHPQLNTRHMGGWPQCCQIVKLFKNSWKSGFLCEV